MRIAALSATIMIALGACSTTSSPKTESPYIQPNQLMAGEIDRRIEQIPYLHGQELVENLLWLVKTGEQTLPSVLAALHNENAKVRSSAAWVVGMIGDRRTIPQLRAAVHDPEQAVRMECARTLVLLGDMDQAPALIEGLDSDNKIVREACHETLKAATGHDFGYDHLAANVDDRHTSVLRWREWWGGYSGDTHFALDYQQKFGIGQPAKPAGEGQAPQVTPAPTTDQNQSGNQTPESTPNQSAAGTEVQTPAAQPVKPVQEPMPPVEQPQPLIEVAEPAVEVSQPATPTNQETPTPSGETPAVIEIKPVPVGQPKPVKPNGGGQ